MNGYAEHHPVGISVRADMLEVVAGYPDEERVNRELAFAVGMMDERDPESLRWVATLLATKLDYIDPDGADRTAR